MKQRHRFTAVVSVTTAVMTVVYACVAVTGYQAFGSAVDLHK
jgi:hypothetical protein